MRRRPADEAGLGHRAGEAGPEGDPNGGPDGLGAYHMIVREKWPRKVRKALNAKWSFTERVSWVDSQMAARGIPDITRIFMHRNGMSSHLIHADEQGIGLVQDRYERAEDVRVTLENAHAARLLSDRLSYSGMIGFTVGQATKDANWIAYVEAYKLFVKYVKEAEPIFTQFYDSQESFYANLDTSSWTFQR